MLLTLAFRFGLLTMGSACGGLAWFSWNFGDPPSWTVFLPTQEAIVLDSRTETWRIGNGTMRAGPVVVIDWPGGMDGRAQLKGLTPSFYAYGADEAAEIAGRYRPGSPAAVKVWNGAPYAARWDWFGLSHAGFLTLLALPLLALGLVIAIALGGDPPDRRAASSRA